MTLPSRLATPRSVWLVRGIGVGRLSGADPGLLPTRILTPRRTSASVGEWCVGQVGYYSPMPIAAASATNMPVNCPSLRSLPVCAEKRAQLSEEGT